MLQIFAVRPTFPFPDFVGALSDTILIRCHLTLPSSCCQEQSDGAPRSNGNGYARISQRHPVRCWQRR